MIAMGVIAGGGCDRATDPMAPCSNARDWMYVVPAEVGATWTLRACRRVHDRTGNPEALVVVALAHLKVGHTDEVLAIAQAAPDQPSSARLWNLAGDVEKKAGDHAAARWWFERALAMQRIDDPRRGFNTAAAIADLAEEDDRFEDALDYYRIAVELADRSREPGARMRSTLALVDVLLGIGDHRAAARALRNVDELVGDATPFRREYLLTLGDVEYRAGHPAAAMAAYQRCLDGGGPEADPLFAAGCNLRLAQLTIAGGRADELARVDDMLARAAALSGAAERSYGPDPDLAGERIRLEAELALGRRQPERAIALLSGLTTDALGTALRARVATRLGEILADRDRTDEAEFALQAAASAVEVLRDGAHYRETRRALASELREPYEALFALRARRGDLGGALAAMERALARDFIDQLAAEPLTATGRPIDASIADTIRRAALRRTLEHQGSDAPLTFVPPPSATILAFFSARGTLWRVTIVRAPRPGLSHVEGPITIEPIGAVADLRHDLEAVRGAPGGPAAAALAARLLPATALTEALVIVPDRLLDGVRFAALPVDGHPLVERHTIALAPTLRIAVTPLATATPATAPVVLGDPTGDLPGARQEAEAVAASLGVTAQLGPVATRAALTSARRASVLHIASHGDRAQVTSSLRLADGELSLAELLTVGLAPDLAVVASCVSAAQDQDAMWTSIAAGLLASGARGVLGVHGRLPDQRGGALIASFYRHGGATAPARALALTQRDAIAAGVDVGVWSMLVYLGSAEDGGRAAPPRFSHRAGGRP